jgi:DNA helicase HerA-like ATPase
MVQRTLIRPPSSRLGPIDAADRTTLIRGSPIFGQYDKALDSESAYEILAERTAARETAQQDAAAREADNTADELRERPRSRSGFHLPDFGTGRTTRAPRRSYQRQTVAEAAIKSVVRSVGSSVGRALVRGILGSLKR